jgi:hypothetical protein
MKKGCVIATGVGFVAATRGHVPTGTTHASPARIRPVVSTPTARSLQSSRTDSIAPLTRYKNSLPSG